MTVSCLKLYSTHAAMLEGKALALLRIHDHSFKAPPPPHSATVNDIDSVQNYTKGRDYFNSVI